MDRLKLPFTFSHDIFRTRSISNLIEGSKGEHSLKKVLGPVELILLGVGAIIGTGIFVVTGVAAADYSGPALVVSFAISGSACALAALCYAEFATTVPIAGSAYTYSYASLGEIWAWIIGWDLILEYSVSIAAVAIGWSGYMVTLLQGAGIQFPASLANPPGVAGGIVNLPAILIIGIITGLLILGIQESARVNNVIVAVKLSVIGLFIYLGVSHVNPLNWTPFMPYGWSGVIAGAAIVFFAYIGFDAVSTAAEEVRDPQKNLPIGIIGSLIICTILYIVVSALLTGMVPYLEFKEYKCTCRLRAVQYRDHLGLCPRLGGGHLRDHLGHHCPPLRADPNLLCHGPGRAPPLHVRHGSPETAHPGEGDPPRGQCHRGARLPPSPHLHRGAREYRHPCRLHHRCRRCPRPQEDTPLTWSGPSAPPSSLGFPCSASSHASASSSRSPPSPT